MCDIAAFNQTNLDSRQQVMQQCAKKVKKLAEVGKAIQERVLDLYSPISYFFVLYIIFAVPTKFITTPKSSVTAYRNWDTYLQCDIFGYPSPVITWTRSLKQLPVGRHVIDGKKLTIKNTTEQDGGAYVCQGTNELGSVMAVIWIFLKDAGKLRI